MQHGKLYQRLLKQKQQNYFSQNYLIKQHGNQEQKNINHDNPLKLVFKIAKKLLNIGATDEEIFKAKIELSEELKNYDKVKNNEQIKALVDFLEYLFLIQDPDLESKYEEYKKVIGGVFKMTIDEIRKIHYTQKGREEGIKEGKIKTAENLLKMGLDVEKIAIAAELTVEEVEEIKKKMINA